METPPRILEPSLTHGAHPGHEPLGHEGPGHETEDAPVPWVVFTGVGLAAATALVFLIVYVIFQFMAHRPLTTAPPNPMAGTDQQQFPPAPRLQDHPADEIKALHQQ